MIKTVIARRLVWSIAGLSLALAAATLAIEFLVFVQIADQGG